MLPQEIIGYHCFLTNVIKDSTSIPSQTKPCVNNTIIHCSRIIFETSYPLWHSSYLHCNMQADERLFWWVLHSDLHTHIISITACHFQTFINTEVVRATTPWYSAIKLICCTRLMTMMTDEYEGIVEWWLKVEHENLRENPATLPLSLPQTSHAITWNRIRFRLVRSVWLMARVRFKYFTVPIFKTMEYVSLVL
jgi:hypothetical protein